VRSVLSREGSTAFAGYGLTVSWYSCASIDSSAAHDHPKTLKLKPHDLVNQSVKEHQAIIAGETLSPDGIAWQSAFVILTFDRKFGDRC
jgi:hypothetical protein